MALVGIDRDPGPTDLKLSRLPAMRFTTPASRRSTRQIARRIVTAAEFGERDRIACEPRRLLGLPPSLLRTQQQ